MALEIAVGPPQLAINEGHVVSPTPTARSSILATRVSTSLIPVSSAAGAFRYVFIASPRKDMQLSIATYSQLSIATSKTHPVDYPAITGAVISRLQSGTLACSARCLQQLAAANR
jgi:hypothetical protein